MFRIGTLSGRMMGKWHIESDLLICLSFLFKAIVKLENLCQIINDNFDIVAIQEIFTPGALKYQLLRNLGPHWDGRWAQPKSKSPQAAEGYAFIWNTRVFKLAEDRNKKGNMEIVEPSIIDVYHLIPGYEKV